MEVSLTQSREVQEDGRTARPAYFLFGRGIRSPAACLHRDLRHRNLIADNACW
jgi:hypothetical protein